MSPLNEIYDGKVVSTIYCIHYYLLYNKEKDFCLLKAIGDKEVVNVRKNISLYGGTLNISNYLLFILKFKIQITIIVKCDLREKNNL